MGCVFAYVCLCLPALLGERAAQRQTRALLIRKRKTTPVARGEQVVRLRFLVARASMTNMRFCIDECKTCAREACAGGVGGFQPPAKKRAASERTQVRFLRTQPEGLRA